LETWSISKLDFIILVLAIEKRYKANKMMEFKDKVNLNQCH